MSFSKECYATVTHDGTPTGKFEEINGVNTYVALPSGDYPKEKAILFLTDIFGAQYVNNKLLADDFAKNGFQVYIPDYFEGDPIPPDFPAGFDRERWFAAHSMSISRAILDKAIEGLKARGITSFGAVGYCYGARHVVDLAIENVIASAVITHPSRIVPAEDFPALLEKSKAPLLINSAQVDNAFPPEAVQKADDTFGNGKYAPGYKREHFLGCSHGFAVRGDLSNPLVKAGKEGAFKSTVEWFLKL
ncbi:hypothetical protein M422DRAFT_23639 [Sphaerobolus stellatus SS14]|nr:hypothetical protein M422DRAFT_23639 [Sphaerobolus stellatus SS14]